MNAINSNNNSSHSHSLSDTDIQNLPMSRYTAVSGIQSRTSRCRGVEVSGIGSRTVEANEWALFKNLTMAIKVYR